MTDHRFDIDPELQELCPALSRGEEKQLEDNLIAEGCREPLIVWKEKNLLLDGHNRFRLCAKNVILYDIIEISLPDREEALLWIIRNQLGRRNLSTFAKAELALKLETILKAEAKDNQGKRYDKLDEKPRSKATRKKLAEIAGTSENTIQRVNAIIDRADPDIKEQVRAGAMSINQAYKKVQRDTNEAKRLEVRDQNAELIKNAPNLQTAIDQGARFSTIVIDPPWHWDDEEDGAGYLGRSHPDYATIPFEELIKLPIEDLAAENAHLYLWVTNRSIYKAAELCMAWGFRHNTNLTWCKVYKSKNTRFSGCTRKPRCLAPNPALGLGKYFRGSTEHIAFGIKGNMETRNNSTPTWFLAPVGGDKHSSKPSEFYDLVERCSPGPYLEIFSRMDRVGWSTFGENGWDLKLKRIAG